MPTKSFSVPNWAKGVILTFAFMIASASLGAYISASVRIALLEQRIKVVENQLNTDVKLIHEKVNDIRDKIYGEK